MDLCSSMLSCEASGAHEVFGFRKVFFFPFLKMISRSFEWSGVPLFGTYAYTNLVQVNGSHAIVPRVAGGVTRTQ